MKLRTCSEANILWWQHREIAAPSLRHSCALALPVNRVKWPLQSSVEADGTQLLLVILNPQFSSPCSGAVGCPQDPFLSLHGLGGRPLLGAQML